MIDIQNLVFNTVFNGMRAVYPELEITRGFIEETAKFPCVVIRETGNVPVQRTNTDECAENYTQVTYQVEVYSDKAGTGMSECRELLALADEVMQGMKFRRTHMNEPLNIQRTIFRQYARYTAIAGKGLAEGENVVFQMYRR